MTDITTKARIAKAESDFILAGRLAAGGATAAMRHAHQWFEANAARIDYGFRKTPEARAAYIAGVARDSLACARSIARDGRSHYFDSHGLIVCTLAADASAGAVGYDRW